MSPPFSAWQLENNVGLYFYAPILFNCLIPLFFLIQPKSNWIQNILHLLGVQLLNTIIVQLTESNWIKDLLRLLSQSLFLIIPPFCHASCLPPLSSLFRHADPVQCPAASILLFVFGGIQAVYFLFGLYFAKLILSNCWIFWRHTSFCTQIKLQQLTRSDWIKDLLQLLCEIFFGGTDSLYLYLYLSF